MLNETKILVRQKRGVRSVTRRITMLTQTLHLRFENFETLRDLCLYPRKYSPIWLTDFLSVVSDISQ